MTTTFSHSIVSRYRFASAYSSLNPCVVRSPETMTTSGTSSFTSAIARSSRFGKKNCVPQCRSESWTSVNTVPLFPVMAEVYGRFAVRPDRYLGLQMGLESPDFQVYRGSEPPRFASQAELECAKVLDYYGIPWEYEPRTFVLEEDEHGRVVEAF